MTATSAPSAPKTFPAVQNGLDDSTVTLSMFAVRTWMSRTGVMAPLFSSQAAVYTPTPRTRTCAPISSSSGRGVLRRCGTDTITGVSFGPMTSCVYVSRRLMSSTTPLVETSFPYQNLFPGSPSGPTACISAGVISMYGGTAPLPTTSTVASRMRGVVARLGKMPRTFTRSPATTWEMASWLENSTRQDWSLSSSRNR